MTFKILTANRLDNGLVVYLGETGWTADICLARRAALRNEIADPYLIDIDDDTPVRWRESIRANGPTVRPDLGYQASRS